MLKTIRSLLLKIVDDIDSGNSNINEEDFIKIINLLNDVSSPLISKYQACNLLNISRAKFDSLVREGKIPRGMKKQGFTELFWNKNKLLESIKNNATCN